MKSNEQRYAEYLLTIDDLVILAERPRRFFAQLIRSGKLKSFKPRGSRSPYILQAEWNRFLERGVTCFRRARSSGGIRPGMRTRKKEGAR